VTPTTSVRNVPESPPPAPRFGMQNALYEVDEAVKQGSIPCLSLALMHGHRCHGCHLVHEAVSRGHLPALQLLVECSQEIDEQCCGTRPLHVAMQACYHDGDVGYRLAELLLQNGAHPGARRGDSPDVRPPLHAAVRKRTTAAALLLLAHGADPNELDARGDTPLHFIMRQVQDWRGVPDCLLGPLDESMGPMVSLLLQHGANPLVQDAEGLCPRAVSWSPRIVRIHTALERSELWWPRQGWVLTCSLLALRRAPVNSTAISCMTQPDLCQVIAGFV